MHFAPFLRAALPALLALVAAGCSDWNEDPLLGGEGSDDDSAPVDDDATPADDDSAADDDTTPTDDDTTPTDDDTAPTDDDTTPTDDDTTPTDDDTTPPGTDDDGDGWTLEGGDCDDSDPSIHPSAGEQCNSVDDDCDGAVDEGWDDDGDGLVDCLDDCPTYVNQVATAPYEGTLTRPFATVQGGLDHAAAVGCTLVRVFQGTYYENVDFRGAAVRVEAVTGPPDTFIDGGGAGSVITFASGEGSASQISGFTLTNGAAVEGGGIHVDSASPVIEGNVISSNVAIDFAQGGAIFVRSGAPSILGNLIEGNDAGWGGVEEGNDGGAIFVRSSSCLLEGNVIRFNTAGDGGGIWLAGSSDHIVHNVIYGNSAYDVDATQGGQGGGIEVHNSVALVVENNVIAANEANAFGGGIAFYEGEASPALFHNVIAWNDCPGGQGGGVLVRASNSPDLRGNVVWRNTGGAGIYGTNDLSTVAYNDVFDNDPTDYDGAIRPWTGTDGNLSVDPAFVTATPDGDPDNDDWHLRPTSPLRDAADPDPTGNDPDGTRADMGVYGGPDGSWP